MKKVLSQIKENYSNNIQLQNILLFFLLGSTSNINDLSAIVPAVQKGENYER